MNGGFIMVRFLLVLLGIVLVNCGDNTGTGPGTGGGACPRFNTNPVLRDIDYLHLTDARDGQTYRYVQIGDLYWMADNLNYDSEERCYYSRSGELSSCSGDSTWCKPNGCWETNKCYNCDKVGRIYSGSIYHSIHVGGTGGTDGTAWINDDMDVCPAGWRIPTKDDVSNLDWYVGRNGTPAEYYDNDCNRPYRWVGHSLKARSGWLASDDWGGTGLGHPLIGNGFDDYGFSAVPTGWWEDGAYRLYRIVDGTMEQYAVFRGGSGTYYFGSHFPNMPTHYFGNEGNYAFSIRCVRDVN